MNSKSYKKILISIIILAFIVRLIYIINTPYTKRQHDLDLTYMLTIYKTGHLPESNEGQYYHPPLNQLIGAMFVKIESIFKPDITVKIIGESLQVLALIYSMILVFIIYNIVKQLKLKERYIIYTMLITAFHPTLIIFSGSINNDNLCLLLIMWSILRLIKWYKKSDIKNTIFLALTTGLAVMTKTNGAILSIPIIYTFLLKLYREIKKSTNKINTIKKYISMLLIFAIISLPIGLWYHVRNYILFNQPILYILDVKDKEIYVGNYSILERLLPFSNQIFQMYCHPFEDYNIPTYLLKCSLYGEYTWKSGGIINIYYAISIILNVIFNIIALYCIIKNIITKNKRNRVWKNILFLLGFTNIITFLGMNFKLQYGCSMDF